MSQITHGVQSVAHAIGFSCSRGRPHTVHATGKAQVKEESRALPLPLIFPVLIHPCPFLRSINLEAPFFLSIRSIAHINDHRDGSLVANLPAHGDVERTGRVCSCSRHNAPRQCLHGCLANKLPDSLPDAFSSWLACLPRYPHHPPPPPM